MLSLKTLFLVGVITATGFFGLAACQRTDDLPGRQPITTAETSREQKLGEKNTETKKLVRGLHEAHQIFEEVFREIWNDKSFHTQSVFSEVERLISLQHNEDTGEQEVSNKCSGLMHRFVTANQKRILREIDCRTQPQIERNLLKIENFGSNKYVWTFETAHLQKGAGLALSILADDIRCEVELEQEGTVKKLRCRGLGQNYNRNEYAVFTEYQFVRGDQNLMFVRGDKFSEFGRLRSHFEMPIPLTGSITYNEKVVATGESTIEELPPAPVAPPPPIPRTLKPEDPNYGVEVTQSAPAQLADHKAPADLFPNCQNEDKEVFLQIKLQPADVDEDCQIIDPEKERQANELVEKLKAGG